MATERQRRNWRDMAPYRRRSRLWARERALTSVRSVDAGSLIWVSHFLAPSLRPLILGPLLRPVSQSSLVGAAMLGLYSATQLMRFNPFYQRLQRDGCVLFTGLSLMYWPVSKNRCCSCQWLESEISSAFAIRILSSVTDIFLYPSLFSFSNIFIPHLYSSGSPTLVDTGAPSWNPRMLSTG